MSQLSVLFVCHGNICRSPAAKSVLEKHLAIQSPNLMVNVDSAGVSVDDFPRRPSSAMRWIAFWRGYRLDWKPRNVRRTDLQKFDLVIAMEKINLSALRLTHSNPTAIVKLLSDFLPQEWPRDVPDPMNRSRAICHTVFDMLETACPGIVAEVQRMVGRRQAGTNE